MSGTTEATHRSINSGDRKHGGSNGRMTSHWDAKAQFCNAMNARGMVVNVGDIIPNSQNLQRCKDTEGKGRDCYYKLFLDAHPAGFFGNWRSGDYDVWVAEGGSELSADEREQIRAEMKRKQAEFAEARKATYDKRAERARGIWKKAAQADDSHPYLQRKGVKAHGLRIGQWWKKHRDTGKPYVVCESALLIPMTNAAGEIRSIQAIFPEKLDLDQDGDPENFRDKDYLSSAEKTGLWHVLGRKLKKHDGRNVIIICEGVATGMSLYEATGHVTVIAFDTSGLLPAGQAVRAKHPNAIIVFACDNDQFTKGNPGVHRARRAAAAVNGVVATPEFSELSDERGADGKLVDRPTDWNDAHARYDDEFIKAGIDAALTRKPEGAEQPSDGDQDEHAGDSDDASERGANGEASGAKGGEKARAAVAELNKKHAVVIVGDKTVVMMERQSARRGHGTEVLFMSVDSFKLFYLNQSVWVEIVDKDGKDKSKFVPIANWWLQSPDRRQHQGITFKPDNTDPAGYYNMWHGHAVEPLQLGVCRNAMKCRRLLRHMKYNACRGNREHYRYMLAWMADLVQDPGVKKGVALVMRGRKGCGKSKIAEVLASLFGGHAIKIAQMKHLLGNFNRHLANKMLAVAEESFWAGNKADDGPLKDMVTSETVMLEAKGIDAVEMESFVRIAMITNNAWVVPASDDERRYFVLDVGDAHLQDNDYFAAIDEQMNRNGNEGRRALLSLLMSFDLSKVNLRRVPETDGLREQRALSLEPHDQFIHDALVGGHIGQADWDSPVTIGKTSLHEAYLEWMKKHGKHHPKDLARFCQHFAKRIDVTSGRPRGKPWEKRERAFSLPGRTDAAEQFGRAMKIDMSHVMEGGDSPFHD